MAVMYVDSIEITNEPGLKGGLPMALAAFTDVYGTEHWIKLNGSQRNSHEKFTLVDVLKTDCLANKQLVRLPCPTTNGVQEVWVGMERFQ